MENTYRLEFNEEQQHFHLSNYERSGDTHGWFTIKEHCTDMEFQMFEAYVNRKKVKKLTKEYILESLSEFNGFLKNLKEYKLSITKD